MKRTEDTIEADFAKSCLLRLHVRALLRLHRWAGEAVNLTWLPGEFPLAALIRYRDQEWWDA
eukprot:13655421-Alexandrium_andersonii.AAC.1